MTTEIVPAVLDVEVVQTAMHKRAQEMSFDEAQERYQQRLKSYDNEISTDDVGSKRRKHLQSLGMVTSALVGTLGGGLAGAILGGRTGAKLGGLLGMAGSLGANLLGQYSGYETAPRTKKQQMAYTNSDGGILAELLVPGVAGYQRGRRWRHVDDAVRNEFAKYKVSPAKG